MDIKATNPIARRDYMLLQKYEAGIMLTGSETKSVKLGHLSLRESFVKIASGEVWLHNAHISPYQYSSDKSYDPTRMRKLLLHKSEIDKITQAIDSKKLTVVPVLCYIRANKVKLEIALARGKKIYEKREELKKRAIEKDIRQRLKTANR